MTVRAATYAFARPAPYLLQRGQAQTIQAPIRHGTDGDLVEVTESGSTVTVKRPDGTSLVSGAAVSVSSSTAGYLLTPSASEALGAGWTVEWSLVIAGVTYPYRQAGYLCDWVPPNVVSVQDLYTRIPELAARVPQQQGATARGGTGEGWQRQIDDAFWELVRRLIEDAHKPWLIREVTGYRDWLLVRSLQLCVQAMTYGADGVWAQKSKELAYELKRVEARLKIQYEDDAATYRRGRHSSFRMAPVGRPVW